MRKTLILSLLFAFFLLRSGSPSLRRALSPVHLCAKLPLKEDYLS